MTSTNYEKFQTSNPVVRRLIDRFYARILALTSAAAPDSILDAGCGEGETIARLGALLPDRVAAVDLSAEAVAATRSRFPELDVRCESVYELPFGDGEFELVICLEVLEHLEDPGRAVHELARVSAGGVVVSVPHEPWFRLGSLMRGNYVSSLGNHPEHVNHWNGPKFERFLATEFERPQVGRSFPWLVADCRARIGAAQPVPA
jgi:2-polyprenyl-3-methyl-5-hydroxy-6-metoxy-1,4-benzoquinol methylase